MTMRDWALTYARLGWRVFPVVPRGKRPLYSGWQRDATTDPDLIGRYWRTDPGPNIGLVCGEAFDAFDIEAPHLPALKNWITESRYTLSATPVARTGRGGIHILVEPVGVGGGRDLYLGREHIGELKSVGGFIVACPSTTVSEYGWLVEPDIAVAAAPAWLLSLLDHPTRSLQSQPVRLGSPANAGHRVDTLARAIEAAGIGRRNKLLYWAMRRALEEGDPPRAAGLALARAAIAAGLAEREVEATIRSAYEASLR